MNEEKINQQIEQNAFEKAEAFTEHVQDELYKDACSQGYYSGYKEGADFVQNTLETELNRLREENRKMRESLENGRDYLIQCGSGCNDSDALESFGFGRNGLLFSLEGEAP